MEVVGTLRSVGPSFASQLCEPCLGVVHQPQIGFERAEHWSIPEKEFGPWTKSISIGKFGDRGPNPVGDSGFVDYSERHKTPSHRMVHMDQIRGPKVRVRYAQKMIADRHEICKVY